MSEPGSGRRAVILELQSFLPPGFTRFQVCKDITKLAELPEGTVRQIGAGSKRRPMFQSEAARLVEEARRRIRQADAGS